MMNLRHINLLLFCFASLSVSTIQAQVVYVDPTTTAALAVYSVQIENAQEQTIEEQTKLQRAQLYVGTQMQRVKTIQNKIYTGLKEVSGTLTNGVQVLRIYQDLNRCTQYATDISNMAYEHPQYAVFATQTSQKTFEQILQIGTDVSSILASGDLNLATAGDRYRLLDNISSNVKLLKVRLIGVKMKLEKAERLGFWQSLNPFQNYINTDRDIVENILHRWDRF